MKTNKISEETLTKGKYSHLEALVENYPSDYFSIYLENTDKGSDFEDYEKLDIAFYNTYHIDNYNGVEDYQDHEGYVEDILEWFKSIGINTEVYEDGYYENPNIFQSVKIVSITDEALAKLEDGTILNQLKNVA